MPRGKEGLALGALFLLLGMILVVALLPAADGRIRVEEAVYIDPLERFMRERGEIREVQTAQLSAISDDPNTSDELRAAAQIKLMDALSRAEKEVAIEGMLRARGYLGLAAVSNDSVSILIKAQEITGEDSAILLEMAMREAGVRGENIKIIPIN